MKNALYCQYMSEIEKIRVRIAKIQDVETRIDCINVLNKLNRACLEIRKQQEGEATP